MEIGKRIKQIRKSKGITATFMAEQLGFKSVSSYSRYENGESTISLEKGMQIAQLLDVDIKLFFEQNLRESRNVM